MQDNIKTIKPGKCLILMLIAQYVPMIMQLPLALCFVPFRFDKSDIYHYLTRLFHLHRSFHPIIQKCQ